MAKILVTGVAGFIGSHVALQLLGRGDTVVGVDNLNDYYDPMLKEARLVRVKGHDRHERFDFRKLDIADRAAMERLFAEEGFDKVIHLAAQAGVRYSIDNPHAYVEANITGTLNILEGCRHNKVQHLTYASTSSVYGANEQMPFSVHHPVNHPLSLYAATKKANELMAHNYSALFNLPTTGLRFFTVYGPWGRPDMALFLFTKKILAGEPIDVFNHGHHKRDFTFVEDICEGVIRASDDTATANPAWDPQNPDPASSRVPWRVHNIGNQKPVDLLEYINCLEEALGKKAIKNMLPLQPGDVPDTWADVSTLTQAVGYRPATPVREGVGRFVEWYRGYYKV